MPVPEVCPECGEHYEEGEVGHYMMGAPLFPGFWTCKKFYGPDGRRINPSPTLASIDTALLGAVITAGIKNAQTYRESGSESEKNSGRPASADP